jgi:peptide-methionine (R)-S-oxide reductase
MQQGPMTMRNDRRQFLTIAGRGGLGVTIGCSPAETHAAERFEVSLTPAEWKRRLSPAQFHILREEGTERPWSSPLNKEKRNGVYACAGCKLPLFLSSTKFESGTGWPSFYAARANAVKLRSDRTLGMTRTEVVCRRCGGHLGHVFDDGPAPTGKRYCMKGAAMTFAAA